VATPKPTEDKGRLVTGQHLPEEDSYELKLRPRLLKEFVGQNKVKENLTVAIEAAKSRGEALDHILLYGPPGLGKTTLASIIANELGVGYQQTSGPTLQIKGDLTAILTNVQDKQVLFFDEVDALGSRRSDMRQSAGRHLINQFLAELDGMGASNEGVLILAATNSPWHLDPAFRRPGRFDRILFVPPPDYTEMKMPGFGR